MNGNRATKWVEGTSADLVADAHALGVMKASPRMVTSWVEDGMLANPEPRKTSAHGSDPRVFPLSNVSCSPDFSKLESVPRWGASRNGR
ncbi:hypothetical protein AB0N97_41410 [Streptomyces collinus]|uniref:hypothetical protein n=1 Tax=Streptomyces collinus TaxID=42684 RepID=UPI003436ACFE